MFIDINLFSKYWNILKKNYQDKTHNEDDFKIYYSILKDYDKAVFIEGIKQVLKFQSYFPRIDEIVRYLPEKSEFKDFKWIDKDLKVQEMTKEEEEEFNNILENLCKEESR